MELLLVDRMIKNKAYFLKDKWNKVLQIGNFQNQTILHFIFQFEMIVANVSLSLKHDICKGWRGGGSAQIIWTLYIISTIKTLVIYYTICLATDIILKIFYGFLLPTSFQSNIVWH